MAGRRKRIEPDVTSPVLGEYFPLESLWSQEAPRPLFASRASALWFIRSNREALVKARAIGIHAGRWIVHPSRFEAFAEALSFARAEARLSAGAGAQ